LVGENRKGEGRKMEGGWYFFSSCNEGIGKDERCGSQWISNKESFWIIFFLSKTDEKVVVNYKACSIPVKFWLYSSGFSRAPFQKNITELMEVEIRGLKQLKRSINANTSLFSTHKIVRYQSPKTHQQKPLHHPSKSTGLWELENLMSYSKQRKV
jgi:hypothetical protein